MINPFSAVRHEVGAFELALLQAAEELGAGRARRTGGPAKRRRRRRRDDADR